jgi:UDP-N-acetylmuramoyl-L-alanyl-D-glutamate--2,6-diaminopimelate ligase
MQLSDLINGIDGLTVSGNAGGAVTGLSADSRQVRAGFVFAALPSSRGAGKGPDGRDFIDQAVRAGAAAILLPEGSPAAVPPGVAVITAKDPRRALAQMAANFAGDMPAHIAAVTGTNGKSSIVTFCRQLWTQLGESGASLGTIGVSAVLKDGRRIEKTGGLTTPDPVALHHNLAELAADGVTHLAMEASSQGLDQRRMDGLRPYAAAFTNFTRDHLDYHRDMQEYLAAKLRLFTDIVADNGIAILNRDMPEYAVAATAARARGLRVIDVSAKDTAAAIHIRQHKPLADGQFLDISVMGEAFSLELPLVGDFQAMNALMALALVTAVDPDDAPLRHRAVAALKDLESVRGRLELAGTLANGAAVYVDYAHTPDGLDTMLQALRPHTAGRLHVVFGCGGDRDPGKRPQMAAVAATRADRVIVTDDNPRNEDPSLIRQQAMAGIPAESLPHTMNIGGRREAMAAALADLGPGDILVVAGKGHEQGQIIGDTVIPFDDVTEIKKLIDTQKNGGADHAPSSTPPVDPRGDRRGPRPDHGRR